ncbi:hypothetical protein V5F49_21025 [Xanthobacter sp. V3C-3]|uniref:hypothetical protein n=1 Tax=Xanthobacter lutulentifluminis TaxID=3119935 RepID=UPI0037297731
MTRAVLSTTPGDVDLRVLALTQAQRSGAMERARNAVSGRTLPRPGVSASVPALR